MAPPAEICAITVGRKRPTEIRSRKCSHLLPKPHRDHLRVKVLKRRSKLRHQLRMLCCLPVVGIETTQLYIEDLSVDSKARPASDDASNSLHRDREVVVGQLIRDRVQVLWWVGNSCGPCW